ncbi:alpha/beta fold hydrolase [Streptomyces gelaticus]
MITSSPAVRRTSAVGLALAACLGAVPTAAAAPAPTMSKSEARLDRYYDQRLGWGSCAKSSGDAMGRDLDKAGVQCADVTVPLDYADPRGRTITVAISRLKATDTRHRIGSILLNNGGPGGTALESPPEFHAWMKKVGPRYDIVGFDPRFVGRSTPLDCGLPVGTNLFSAGHSRAGFERQVALQKDLADKCRATNASVLPHVTTRNTARDMDVIRGALDEKKISYFGYSYGTYLGTVYTQMFLQSAVICGNVAAPRDPEVYWRAIERSRAAYPRFGALANNIGPCAFWDRPREKPTQVKHDTKALIVSATGDTRTAHKGAVALHGLLPSSKLITLKGANRHAIYGLYENACVDNEVNQYLATGRLPANDRTCSKQAGLQPR